MPSVNGLIVMMPTSVDKTGTGSTATINSNGSVTFSACTILSLNGVFTSSYDNYMITFRTSASGGGDLNFRFRLSGTDATGTNYSWQNFRFNGTSVTSVRATSLNVSYFGSLDVTGNTRDGHSVYLFGPSLSQPTNVRSVEAWSGYNNTGADMTDYVTTHSVSTAYDGITIYPGSGSFAGVITVFGFNQ